MSPPSVISRIIRKTTVVFKLEKIMIRTVCRNICPLLIPGRIFINPLSVQPFIERTTVIEYAVQNHTHSTPVCLFHQFHKKCIAGFQICRICHTCNIAGSLTVVSFATFQKISLVFYNLSDMRINVLIILNIILMIGRGYKQRIKVNGIYS